MLTCAVLVGMYGSYQSLSAFKACSTRQNSYLIPLTGTKTHDYVIGPRENLLIGFLKIHVVTKCPL